MQTNFNSINADSYYGFSPFLAPHVLRLRSLGQGKIWELDRNPRVSHFGEAAIAVPNFLKPNI